MKRMIKAESSITSELDEIVQYWEFNEAENLQYIVVSVRNTKIKTELIRSLEKLKNLGYIPSNVKIVNSLTSDKKLVSKFDDLTDHDIITSDEYFDWCIIFSDSSELYLGEYEREWERYEGHNEREPFYSSGSEYVDVVVEPTYDVALDNEIFTKLIHPVLGE